MSDWEKLFFVKLEVNVPPATRRGDTEWAREQKCKYYLGWGDKREVWGVGHDCCRGRQVGERSTIMGSACIYPSSVVLPAKVRIEMAILCRT